MRLELEKSVELFYKITSQAFTRRQTFAFQDRLEMDDHRDGGDAEVRTMIVMNDNAPN